VADNQARLGVGQLFPDPGHPVRAGGQAPGEVRGVPEVDGRLVICRKPICDAQVHLIIVPAHVRACVRQRLAFLDWVGPRHDGRSGQLAAKRVQKRPRRLDHGGPVPGQEPAADQRTRRARKRLRAIGRGELVGLVWQNHQIHFG
jgi:hypothetical protein